MSAQCKKKLSEGGIVYQHSVKGQASFFWILGIGIFVLLSIFLVLLYPDTVVSIFSSLSLGKDAAKASLAAEECLQDVTREALELVEAQGGYTRPLDAISLDEIPIGYISREGRQVLSLEDIEQDIAQYTDVSLSDCFEEGFEQYTVEQNIDSVSIHFEEKHMLVTTAWDLRFVDEEGEAAFDIHEVDTKISSSFKILFEEAERFIPDAPSIDLSLHYYQVHNVSVHVMQKGNESIAYFSQGEEYFVTGYG